MRSPRRLFAVALCCAALAWLAGPAGRLLVVLPLLLFGPGYLLERAIAAFPTPSMALRPAIWLGLSLSIVALLYEWATAFGLRLTPAVLYALATSCGLGVIWRFLRDTTTDERRPTVLPLHPPDAGGMGRWSLVSGWWSVGLLLILALTFWTRFMQIKDLALPAWVDSVHHALMIRVAAERGQAPYSLRPYLPVDQLPYHWGYHVFAAAVMQLSGLPLGQTMLWVGQALNALQALTVAALAAYLWRRPLAGVVAALAVGLLSIMPAYYVSWGRYTQLTGLLLLPPLAIVWHAGLRAPARSRLICIAVLLAGLSLIHFRVLVFALTYLATSGATWAFDQAWTPLAMRIRHAAASAGLALALAAPWLWLIALRTLLPALARPQNLIGGGSYNALTDGLLWAGHNRWLIALALAAALWGIAHRSRVAVEQVGWVAEMALLTNPELIGLPYIWLITNDAVVISLFIPIGVLLGGGACMLMTWLESRYPTGNPFDCAASAAAPELVAGLTEGPGRRQPTTDQPPLPPDSGRRKGSTVGRRLSIMRGAAVTLLGALALWGAWDLRSVINPGTILATNADVAAITWAAEHTPADARFLINAVPWLGSYRGVDGGWWLLPLAGRWVSTPPVLFVYGAPDYVRETREIGRTISGFRTGQEQQIYQLIARERITYIYLGMPAGSLSPGLFASNPAFEKVYERDGVTILAVHR
jgi:hypothetical protein